MLLCGESYISSAVTGSSACRKAQTQARRDRPARRPIAHVSGVFSQLNSAGVLVQQPVNRKSTRHRLSNFAILAADCSPTAAFSAAVPGRSHVTVLCLQLGTRLINARLLLLFTAHCVTLTVPHNSNTHPQRRRNNVSNRTGHPAPCQRRFSVGSPPAHCIALHERSATGPSAQLEPE